MRTYSSLVVFCLFASAFALNCHYSCATCTGSSYTQCLTCSDSGRNVQYGVSCDGTDQSILNQIGGLCGSPAYSRANPLGVILIIVAIAAGVLLKSQYVFYFILSLQTLGLVSLVEAAFPSSLNTLLGAFDYFMLFSIMQQNTKPQSCKLMLRNMYRMNDFLGTTSFKDNAPPILAIVYFLAILLAVGSIFKKFRKTSCSSISDQMIEKILIGLRTSLLLMMQQAILLIYVGIRFSSLNGGLIFCIVIFCIAAVYLIVDCNFNPLPYFRSSELMNICFAKRLMLPALVVMPYQFSYSLIVFLVGFALIDLLFLTKASSTKVRNYAYSLVELVCIGLLGGFAIADLGNNSSSQASGISIFAAIILVVYLIIFIVEIALALRKKLKGNKVLNEAQEWDLKGEFSEKNSALRDQDTISDIHNQNEGEAKVTPIQQGFPLSLSGGEKKVPNLLEQPHKRERKFKVQEVK